MSRSARLPLLFSLLTLGACAPSSPSDRAPAPTAPPASLSTPAPTVSSSAAAAPPPAPIDIGMPARPALPSAATLKHLHDGLAHHHKADYARSLVEFEAALALSPDDALARFDVACASARLGHFGRAEQELDTLLRLDLPAFLPRFEADPDLAALRGGPEGARLRARALVIADAYQRAAATGVSAVVFRPRPPEVDHALSDPRWLRAGVWIHEARRFVALAPEVPATAAWFDRAHRRTVVAHLDIVDCASDFCPALGGAEVSVFALGRAEPVATTHRDPDEDRLYQLSVRAGDAVWAELDTWSAHPDIRRFDGGDGSGAFAASAAPPVDAVRATLDVSPWGSLLTTQPEGLRVERGTLVRASGAPISLGPLHKRGAHAVVAHGERAVVVSSEVGCECNEREDSVYRHAVSIIDLAAGTATRFESGDGVAAVAIDDGGAVYLQVGEAVRRFPSIDAMPAGPGEPLAEGVLLTVPRHANSNCCGL